MDCSCLHKCIHLLRSPNLDLVLGHAGWVHQVAHIARHQSEPARIFKRMVQNAVHVVDSCGAEPFAELRGVEVLDVLWADADELDSAERWDEVPPHVNLVAYPRALGIGWLNSLQPLRQILFDR